MKPDQGLFQLGFEDHHAVLGVPITADAKAVRKRYLAIARRLHPDSLSGASVTDAQRASEILSKLVNPAYETLSQDKNSTEHMLVLKLKGQSLQRAGTAPSVSSAAAQDLLKAPHAEQAYRQAVNGLAEHQFDQLGAVSEVIGTLSELNLVFLYRSGTGEAGATAAVPRTKPAAAAPAASAAAPPPPPPPPVRQTQSAIVSSYINRAQEYERNQDYSRAILELREAVKSYPSDSHCHSYLGALYLKAGQPTMARIHAKRALELNPTDERSKMVQARVDKATAGGAGAKAANPKTSGSKPPEKGGGLFGLFGGKKK